ncbi:ErmE/ErmH/ErmO/ErmR family 23S rRNA (adenine(2058)-N(6))-methyltransferase [Glycomyces algeriensis]|uniref:23S rRNA (Adenine(2058)-N(6))-methyltransferase Erm(O) n=1 Tax=Glycomyces algeriensis TaxID=256037 RepID=A0A9W6GCU1_9ACTN|nr:ErmE/ErmH/ErmO/ErmR family 23S rRNA (adenine(2058)-N(6))-methyltransferase [Glycomyces algeriensis]MDA1366808.1 ErmE/ErmH/ErmO/ErmR family 23S rRNA (adenine(2058)-N(6))-methyltransferase [Glycomyces algeriensis]MDA1368659.1 ErmE/ErmH/ErmO/ErmR family 23S rRNA (adenine(2058)-N(6))-methyltransferase [Glycomyces algeriensis]MDR7351695.1 23S rRNA (adenine-N6)-dimethyltransferase [Glycomyces algeriensis]GLI44418.1 23S rRNA (adenine(2058)-N(6))-methyltransferase Erm(O) [Glycomyces algeriensis]
MSRSQFPRARAPHTKSARDLSNRKALSQNFLRDAHTARAFVDAADVRPNDHVIEVGPGDGMVTRALLDRARRVTAYEKDRHFVERLHSRLGHHEHFRCHQADFRDVTPPQAPFSVVANAPFGITTDIVRWCLRARTLTSAALITQLEFARKHTGDYGRWSRLTVAHWPEFDFELGMRLDRREFRPVPQVDAAVLHLHRRTRPLLPPDAMVDYRDLVDLGFSGIGGALAASLCRVVPRRVAHQACAEAGIARDQVVGLVPPDRWISLFHALTR